MTLFSTVGLFIALSLLIALVLGVIAIMPWLRASRATDKPVDNQLLDINIAVFRARLAELKTDKDTGTIDDSHYQSQKLELERQLLDAQRTVTPMITPGIKSRLIIVVWVPVLAAMAYLMVGDRTPVFELWAAEDKVGQVADDLLTGKIDQPPAWAIEDGQQLITAMQTNVYRHADDYNRWMRLSELFLSLEATDSALEALSRAYRLSPTTKRLRRPMHRLASLPIKGSWMLIAAAFWKGCWPQIHSMKARKCSWQWVRHAVVTLRKHKAGLRVCALVFRPSQVTIRKRWQVWTS